MTTNIPRVSDFFSLRIQITPEIAPIQTRTFVTARLTNTSSVTIVVNRRMLLNHPGFPGEMRFDVVGPPGYRNTISFRVNAGDAPEESFVALPPGDHVFRQWPLEDFVSTQAPGDYEITMTYHNDRAHSPCGRTVTTGIASATSRITRR